MNQSEPSSTDAGGDSTPLDKRGGDNAHVHAHTHTLKHTYRSE